MWALRLAVLPALFLTTAPARVTQAATRRAVLVGIDEYVAKPGAAKHASASLVGRPSGAWVNLQGSVNDVEAIRQILIARFGFKPGDIHTILNQAATRTRILSEIRKSLVDPAQPGDVELFFYAGHGSQVRNSLSSEPDKLDESIVPVDAVAGVPDIRDKEIAALFNQAIDKKALLTVVFDSCHSGSITRGQLRPVRVRSVMADMRDAGDPANPPALESRGAVVLAAAQSHQLAAEIVDDSDTTHGLLTWALVRTLRSAPVDESSGRLFLALRGLMHSVDASQDPYFSASAERKAAPLFGGADQSLAGATVVAMQSVLRDGTVLLQGGLAAGLHKDCELRAVGGRADSPTVVRVTELQGMTLSRALLIEGQLKDLQPGTLFEVVRWAAPDEPMLRVWTGASNVDMARVLREGQQLQASLRQSGLRQADELEAGYGGAATVLGWDGDTWTLSTPARTTAAGAHDAASVLKDVTLSVPAGSVYVDFPPPVELRLMLGLGDGTPNDAIRVVTSPLGADYVLVGRYRDDGLEYAWVKPLVGEAREHSSLPDRTDWIAVRADNVSEAAATLRTQALRLGVIRTWLQLESPPDSHSFGYHLALRNSATNEVRTAGPTRDGDSYGLVLVADAAIRQSTIAPRYVYVFALDSAGQSTLLYPSINGDGGENHFPVRDQTGAFPAEIPLGRRDLFSVTAPLGVDTYILLSTATPLADPGLLEGDAIRSRPRSRAVIDPLTRLLSRALTISRSPSAVTPTDWAIERLIIESLPALK